MDSAIVRNNILQIIKAYLTKTEYTNTLTDEMFAKVCLHLQRHDIAHLAGVILYKSALNQEQADTCFRLQYLATARHEKLKYAQKELYQFLEDHHVPFLPLKGAVIAEYYEEPWHRTSSDLDVMIPKEYIDSVSSLLQEELHYIYRDKTNHDLSFESPNGIYFELHYDLDEKRIAPDELWLNSSLVDGKNFQYTLSSEIFIIYHIAHMAKHFQNGGCGFRSFIDLWILRHSLTYDTAFLSELLKNKSLKKFADKIIEVTDVWVQEKPSSPLSDYLTDYIAEGGIYGNVKNKATIACMKKKNLVQLLWSRMFLPYGSMKAYYPRLQRFPFLFPFYQIGRWLRLLKPKKRMRFVEELHAYRMTNDEYENNPQSLLNELDLL